MYEIISQYLEYLELEKGLATNTIDAYRRDLYDFADGASSIEDVDRLYINTYIRSLKERNCKDSQLFRNTQLFAHKATGRVARVLRKSKFFGKYSVTRFTIQILFINL